MTGFKALLLNWLKIKKTCNNAADVAKLFSNFTRRAVSRGILALMGFASSTPHRRHRKQAESGRIHLSMEISERRRKVDKLEDNDAAYEAGAGMYISRTFMCNPAVKAKYGDLAEIETLAVGGGLRRREAQGGGD
ncbi:hypothetical protein MMC26_000696 [Xylographa opegraphella]|nr:hypothetical protein [Xylographa opegraphella]